MFSLWFTGQRVKFCFDLVLTWCFGTYTHNNA